MGKLKARRSEGVPPSVGSRVRFRGQGALAPGVSPWTEGVPPSMGFLRFGFEGKMPSLRVFSFGARAPRPRWDPGFGFEGKLPSLRVSPSERMRPAERPPPLGGTAIIAPLARSTTNDG